MALVFSYKTVSFGTKRQVGEQEWDGNGETGHPEEEEEKEEEEEEEEGWARKHTWNKLNIKTHIGERAPFFWLSEIGFGWLGQ